MYSEQNELSLGIINSVIWKLHETGYPLAAQLIENERDKDAIMTYDKQLDEQVKRMKLYAEIETRHAKLSLQGQTKALDWIQQINKMDILAKVYFIFLANPEKLRQIEKVDELYNRVAYSYLSTFEGWKADSSLDIKAIAVIRPAFSSVERSVRFIKSDKPEMFHPELIKESGEKSKRSKDKFGNNVVGIN